MVTAARRFALIGASALIVLAVNQAAAEINAGEGEKLFQEGCALCHTAEGQGGQAPNLHGVFGRKAGSTDFPYSQAMKDKNWVWDTANLDRFLQDPQEAVPGTTMGYSVPDADDRADLIAYLRTLTPQAAEAAKPGDRAEAAAPKSDDTASGDWRDDYPGRRHRIVIAELPPPYETRSASNPPRRVQRTETMKPQAPTGFKVELFASGLRAPRLIRTAPNGDLFISESAAGRVRILRPSADGKFPAGDTVYANGLAGPFGIAFYPPGPNPSWVYIAETNRVVRYRYAAGDLKPAEGAEVVVPQLASTQGGHVTRDIAFSADGTRMYVSVGSASNVAQGIPSKSPEEIAEWQKKKGLGAAWGFEENRANVLVFTPEGKNRRVFASGIRNCVGLATHPETGDLYCSTNERDGLGDNLVPDYVTRVREGQFYGWPWWYMGDHRDPRWDNARPDLDGKVSSPDVPVQAHSASLGMTFYNGNTFPADYRGSAFAAFHGSWNRARRTGYKIVRVIMRDGVPTGEYEDFLTGFVVNNENVWGRPVGVTEGKDGALFVTEDASGTLWRITFVGNNR